MGSSTFLYFAYGSNMLTARIADRCPSAKPVTLARANGYDLVFTKRSVDKSGKATLVPSEGSKCPGVIFEIDAKQRAALEEFEGPGYVCNKAFSVVRSDGSACAVTTYLAQECVDGLKPYDWYLALIIAGCNEHALDADHVAKLREIAFVADPDSTRKTYLSALQALRKSGITELKTLLTAEVAANRRVPIAADAP